LERHFVGFCSYLLCLVRHALDWSCLILEHFFQLYRYIAVLRQKRQQKIVPCATFCLQVSTSNTYSHVFKSQHSRMKIETVLIDFSSQGQFFLNFSFGSGISINFNIFTFQSYFWIFWIPIVSDFNKASISTIWFFNSIPPF